MELQVTGSSHNLQHTVIWWFAGLRSNCCSKVWQQVVPLRV